MWQVFPEVLVAAMEFRELFIRVVLEGDGDPWPVLAVDYKGLAGMSNVGVVALANMDIPVASRVAEPVLPTLANEVGELRALWLKELPVWRWALAGTLVVCSLLGGLLIRICRETLAPYNEDLLAVTAMGLTATALGLIGGPWHGVGAFVTALTGYGLFKLLNTRFPWFVSAGVGLGLLYGLDSVGLNPGQLMVPA